MPEDYGWIITRDYLAEDDTMPDGTDVGRMGPGSTITPETSETLAKFLATIGGKHPGNGNLPDGATWWRMFDDDDILYYEGILIGDAEDEESGFSPLDNYGKPGAGCVRIDYYRDGEWETL
jgi:hypothetical protein